MRTPDVIERRHLTPGAWDPLLIDLVQGGGLGRTVRADQVLAATVGACDGSLTLAQIIGAVCALTDEDERAAEIEAAWEAEGMTLMSVPTELVPEIRALLARRQTA